MLKLTVFGIALELLTDVKNNSNLSNLARVLGRRTRSLSCVIKSAPGFIRLNFILKFFSVLAYTVTVDIYSVTDTRLSRGVGVDFYVRVCSDSWCWNFIIGYFRHRKCSEFCSQVLILLVNNSIILLKENRAEYSMSWNLYHADVNFYRVFFDKWDNGLLCNYDFFHSRYLNFVGF